MEEAETRISEFLKEKVKRDHEEKDKAERKEGPAQVSDAAVSGDVSNSTVAPPVVTGWMHSRAKRRIQAAKRIKKRKG